MSASKRFRKLPVEIEAVQWDGTVEGAVGVISFCEGRCLYSAMLGRMVIQTLEGNMEACPGDWIIKGVAGEFYPCKPGIFAATYEPADGEGK